MNGRDEYKHLQFSTQFGMLWLDEMAADGWALLRVVQVDPWTGVAVFTRPRPEPQKPARFGVGPAPEGIPAATAPVYSASTLATLAELGVRPAPPSKPPNAGHRCPGCGGSNYYPFGYCYDCCCVFQKATSV